MYDSAKQESGSQVHPYYASIDFGKIRGGLTSSSKQNLNLSNQINKLASSTEVIREEEERPSRSYRVNHSGENDDEVVMLNSMQ